jgi:Pyruvate/2-oxoacid:ferredoxin oxidoreductase gamma subunit
VLRHQFEKKPQLVEINLRVLERGFQQGAGAIQPPAASPTGA